MRIGVILHGVTGRMGEVEAIYQSAAAHGAPISHEQFLHYPDAVPADWQPERLQGLLGARR